MTEKPIDVITYMDLCVDMMVYGDVVPQFGQTEKVLDNYCVDLGGS
ncbi:hypothetical protein [Paenibacillus montanisoli]|nr:hypothetical protein [Paenibacillus montanisoli]